MTGQGEELPLPYFHQREAHLRQSPPSCFPAADPTCPRCKEESQTLEHWLQRCPNLDILRQHTFGSPSPPLGVLTKVLALDKATFWSPRRPPKQQQQQQQQQHILVHVLPEGLDYCCSSLGKASSTQLVRKILLLLHLVGDKPPPTVRNSSNRRSCI